MYQGHIKLCGGEDLAHAEGAGLPLTVDAEVERILADRLPVRVEVRSLLVGSFYIFQAPGPAGDNNLLPLVDDATSPDPEEIVTDHLLITNAELPKFDNQLHIFDLDLSTDSFMDL